MSKGTGDGNPASTTFIYILRILMEQKFEILTDAEHVARRPGMYIGSCILEEYSGILNYEWGVIHVVPDLS